MKTMLKDKLDLEAVYKAPKYSGGHEDVMNVLFKDAKVIASYIESAYEGEEAFVYYLDQEYILVTDYFGSCSGCDAWEDANDEEARNLCVQLANNAQRFNSVHELITFLEVDVPADVGSYYAESTISSQILEQIKKNVVHMRDVNIDDLLDEDK